MFNLLAALLWASSIVTGALAALPHLPVTVKVAELIDYSRHDPLTNSSSRSVMVSIFQPVDEKNCEWTTIPYAPPLTSSVLEAYASESYNAPPGFFSSQSLQVCGSNNSRETGNGYTCGTSKELPLVIFSPGLNNVRYSYTILAASLAATGRFRVVTVDHPGDGMVVELPNNRVEYAVPLQFEQLPQLVDIRAADISFVRRALGGASCRSAAIGHSFGGASSITALARDVNFEGALNLDGTIYGDVVEKGTPRGKPVLLFASDAAKNGTVMPFDPTWDAIWPRLRGWKKLIELTGSVHSTFSDLPMLAASFLNGQPVPPAWRELIGTIEADRALRITVEFISAFLDLTFTKKTPALLTGSSPMEFPEVKFRR